MVDCDKGSVLNYGDYRVFEHYWSDNRGVVDNRVGWMVGNHGMGDNWVGNHWMADHVMSWNDGRDDTAIRDSDDSEEDCL